MLASLALNSRQTDARNVLGVIYEREEHTSRARLLWSQLVRDVPDYGPARANLALLGSQEEVVPGKATAVRRTPAAAVKTISDKAH